MFRGIKKGNKVCRLNKALYSLRQAGRTWHSKLNQALIEMEAIQSKCDPACILARIGKGKIPTLILTYVDDILILSPEKTNRQGYKRII